MQKTSYGYKRSPGSRLLAIITVVIMFVFPLLASASDAIAVCTVHGTVYSNIFDVHRGLEGRITILYGAAGAAMGAVTINRKDADGRFLKSWGIAESLVHSADIGNIEIEGSVRFAVQTSNALVLLKTKAPDAYRTVTNYVGAIQEAGRSGMMAYGNPPVFEMDDSTAFSSLTWCAGAIAHDSMHSKLYHDYQENQPGFVPPAVWSGPEAEHKCLVHQLQVLQEIGASNYEIQYCAHTPDDFCDAHKYPLMWDRLRNDPSGNIGSILVRDIQIRLVVSNSADLTATNNSKDITTLNVTGLPEGVTASFSTNPITGTGSAMLNLAAANYTAAGVYPLAITMARRDFTNTDNMYMTVGSNGIGVTNILESVANP
jgi:hypothetical protein